MQAMSNAKLSTGNTKLVKRYFLLDGEKRKKGIAWSVGTSTKTLKAKVTTALTTKQGCLEN